MIDTIKELENTISEIRSAINSGIENDPNLDEENLLKPDSPFKDYVSAINSLHSSITSTDQQIIILYTYAKDEGSLEDKNEPEISWPKDEEEIVYGMFYPDGWVPDPHKPISQDPNDKLWIRFVSVKKGEEAVFGTPIQMTGDKGEKGNTGEPGADAVILTQIHRLIKLYCLSEEAPLKPKFFKSIEVDNKYRNELDVKRLYYKDGSKNVYVDSTNSLWHSQWPDTWNPGQGVWEIEVDINSKSEEVVVLSEPINKIIGIKEVKTEFAVSGISVDPPEEGWSEDRPIITDDSPWLWSKTTITFKNDTKTENISLIQELPTVIKGITTLYLATSDTSEPTGAEAGWSEEIPMHGPVIWKKEITEYTSEIGGEEDSSTRITITPVSIQGESGIKFIGSVESKDELTQEALLWEDNYIGRIGILVGKNTYIWYGTSEPVPSIEGVEKIGKNYWLDLGQIHVCDWAAKEGESGHIQNRTHYVDTFKGTFGDSNDGDLPANASNIKIWQGNRSWEYQYPSQINDRIKDPTAPEGTISNFFKWKDGKISTVMMSDVIYTYSYDDAIHQLDSKFVSLTTNILYRELKQLRDAKRLIPGMQYRITDYITITTQDETQSANHPFDVIVTADNEFTLNEKARAIQHEGDAYFAKSNLAVWQIWYCLDNDTNRFVWADAENGKGVIYRMIDEFNNDVPYDFKNIKFSHGGDWMYTFSVGNGVEWIDYTVIDSDERPISNTIKGNLDFSRKLYKNIFYNTNPDDFSPPICNYIGQNSKSCTLIDNCQYNVIEDRVINVELRDAYSNKIEFGSDTIFIYDSMHNTIGKRCSGITIMNESSAGANDNYGYNNFLTNCHDIWLKYCDYNTFGHNCHGRDHQSVLVTNCKYCHCMNGVEFTSDLMNKTGQIINYPGN